MRSVVSRLLRPAFALVILATGAAGAAAEGPFSTMAGAWSGAGTITVNNNKERLRCRATYGVSNAGSTVDLVITCASDSYKFHLQSGVNYVNGSLNGSWSESTYKAAGSISGSASAGQIRATATGAYFTAILNLRTTGNNQAVTITAPGTEISSIVVSLNKAGGATASR